MNPPFVISAAYQWSNEPKRNAEFNHSEAAIKHISKMVTNRFNNKNKYENIQINYKRLRASAGKTMLDSIVKRIQTSNVIIFDITEKNANVFLELGIAIALTRNNNDIAVYLIREKKNNEHLLQHIPSDLQGYFISEYTVNGKGEAAFHDNNSLRMCIESDVKDYYKMILSKEQKIDEINIQ